MFDLPFKGQDLKPGQRIYNRKKVHTADPNHQQHFGFDLTAAQLDSKRGTWSTTVSGTDGTKNQHSVVYGMPVYAIADGEIIRAWRNAPENPRPEQAGDTPADYLHPGVDKGEIHAGGNFLQMTLDDGSQVRYSHFIPGTVPQELCPHEAKLLPNARNSDTDVAPGDRARVTRGQFLGKVGNAGNSDGPHLHFHRWSGSDPLKMEFRRGLASPWKSGKADINHWESFAKQTIPAGPTLIWPPRTARGEFARHGATASEFRRLFLHLADSNMWPTWFDGYTVGDKLWHNHVWRPAQGNWRALTRATSEEHQEQMDWAERHHWGVVFVNSYLERGSIRYVSILHEQSPGRWRAHHGLSANDHQTAFDKAKADGLGPICVSVVSVGGKRRYTTLYRSDSIGSWLLDSTVRESEYQAVFDANDREGRAPLFVKSYMHDGSPMMSVVFASSAAPVRARHLLSVSGYQTEYDAARKAGFHTRIVTAFDGAQSKHRFVGVWGR